LESVNLIIVFQAERDEFKLQAEQARAREADSSHERALLRRALHRVAHGLPPPVAGDDFDTRTLAALAMSPLASAVASAAKNKRAMVQAFDSNTTLD
jgi:hypothetical protein